MFLVNGIQRGIQRAQPAAGSWWVFLSNDPSKLVKRHAAHPITVKRRGAREQFIQKDAQRVDIATGIDIRRAYIRLLGAHVERRAHHLGMGSHE